MSQVFLTALQDIFMPEGILRELLNKYLPIICQADSHLRPDAGTREYT